MEARREQFLISTDRGRLKLNVITAYLKRSYWAQGRSREVIETSLQHSECFGLYDEERGGKQIGFARAITDYATYAYLADVFVLESYQGKGLGKWLVKTALNHPDLSTCRWELGTKDAHALYAQFGFERPTNDRAMKRVSVQAKGLE